MKIALDCPGCGKRYEVDASLAGKKSRCKECGNTFRIPDEPSASAAAESISRPAASTRTRDAEAVVVPSVERTRNAYQEVVSAAASPSIIASGAARGTVVFNCPRCFKRYEVDAALSGKKSRCKDCKEVFTIPPPITAFESRAEDPVSSAKKSPLAGRNFAVIPEEVVSVFEEDLEFEPAEAVRRAPPPVRDEEPMQLSPRRIDFPIRAARSSRRREEDTEVGVTVAAAYVALGILGFIILAIWHAAGEPGSDKLGRVFGASLMILCVLGILMVTWGNIWLYVIAFRDRIEQGIFCLLVPLYALYYIFTRWRETRGIFAMCFAPSAILLLFALFGGLVLGVAGPTAFVRNLTDRLQSLAPELTDRPNLNKQEVAKRVLRDYIQAMNRFTEELASIDPVTLGRMGPIELRQKERESQNAENELVVAQNVARMLKMNPVDAIAVKTAVGAEMRAAIIALKYQFTRLATLPGAARRFSGIITELDQLLTAWEAPADGSTETNVANLVPAPAAQPDLAPGTMPRGGMPPGGMPSGFPPGRMPGRFETFEAHYDRMRSQYGDRAVMVVLSGLPLNADPAHGVTKRDVEDAIDKRLRALVPAASQSMSMGSGDARSICLAPVDDVKRLAESIDFGKASFRGSRVEVVVAKEYVASVPRLAAELRLAAEPPITARPHNRRDDEPQIPANADAVTKCLIQLQSADNHRMKDALNRLSHIRPTARMQEVHAAIAPLLEHEDVDLIRHAVQVLAVWQSPEAMAKLIDMVNDSRVFLRWDVIKSLGKYDDETAAKALTERLKEDGHVVEGALKSMGSIAEPPLIALLRNPDADLRRKACGILKFVGTSATLKAMAKIPPDSDIGARMAAQEAIKMIRLRASADDSEAPAKKKADPPPASPFRKKK
jgi:HEAT repeats